MWYKDRTKKRIVRWNRSLVERQADPTTDWTWHCFRLYSHWLILFGLLLMSLYFQVLCTFSLQFCSLNSKPVRKLLEYQIKSKLEYQSKYISKSGNISDHGVFDILYSISNFSFFPNFPFNGSRVGGDRRLDYLVIRRRPL